MSGRYPLQVLFAPSSAGGGAYLIVRLAAHGTTAAGLMLASVMSVVTLAIAVVLVRTANSKQLTNDALRRKRFKRATVNWWFWRCSPGGALDTRNAARGYALEDPKALPTLASPKSLPGAERAVTGTGGAAEPLLLRLPAQPDPPPGESVGPNSDSATQHPPDGVPPEPM